MTERFEISRRKALAALGTIGVAAGGAGVGTSAYFNDTESFEGNSITAGEVDLWVSASSTYNGGDATNSASDIGRTDGSELPAGFYDLGDVKPGDSGTATICFDVVDNPAWVWAQGVVTANDENGQSEPEAVVDNTTGTGNGELAGALNSTLFLDKDGDGEQVAADKEVFGDLFDGHFSSWQLLGEFTGSVEPAGDGELDHCLTVDWELPTSVGNEVQTDKLNFAIALYAEQARHNSGYVSQDICYSSPENPTANLSTEQVFELCIDYESSGGELEKVTYNVELEEPWSDPTEPNANMALGFCGTQDGDGNSLPLDPIGDYQIGWSSSDGFHYKVVTNQGNNPSWSNWQELPSGISGEKNGTSITISSTVGANFPYDPGDIYGIVGNASYGGSTHANISSDPANSWSSAKNWTSTEYFLPTKIPDSV
ncbi:SipW-dependent-type signal peptide-containing protein [Halobellus sp. H-GB7]|uniref:SipW-dependent-type signal peptide-containing protein n=1 Tax=Halobellus sp. H-GB7 TaxID=3069756 RepID=UPI0027AFB464|nr:SipW-dependent-type signal peptide-containing protein [Halobellus sp. H-GB7]MDQ2053890.1 SipW-dependent-type signal peptide-containing protein [Halobellus sp. H-GB7]